MAITTCGPGLFAQSEGWSLENIVKNSKLTYGFNNRQTHLLRDATTIYGAYLGIAHRKKMKHILTVNSTLWWVGKPLELDDHHLQMKLHYFGLAEEYKFWKIKKWDLSTYVHLGAGRVYFRQKNPQFQESTPESDWIYPVELGIHSEYPILKWAYLKLGVGYRYVFENVPITLSNYYYKVAIGIDLNYLYNWAW